MSEYIQLQKQDDAAADGLMYEDELSEDITDEEYAAWFDKSFVDGVRLGPRFVRSAPWPPRVESSVSCALPDLRYVIYAGIVAAGALLALMWLVRGMNQIKKINP